MQSQAAENVKFESWMEQLHIREEYDQLEYDLLKFKSFICYSARKIVSDLSCLLCQYMAPWRI